MSSYVEELGGAGSVSFGEVWQRLRARLQAAELHRSLEFWLYAAIVIAAGALRFTDLGARALHHDESLHATFSFYLATGKGYVHDPLMHGPILFHMTALVYLLFGASDASARFAPAMFGTLIVLVPLLLRPWLGRVGAVAAAIFLAISPSLLYYSRFIRNEAWVAVWTLGLLICILRYREDQRDRWLYGAAAMLMFEFVSKETAFLFSAILIVYLEGAAAYDWTEAIAARRDLSVPARTLVFIALLPTAWLLTVLWPWLARLRARAGLEEMPASGVLLLVLGLLAAPQFSAAVRVPLKKLGFDLAALQQYDVFGHYLTRMQLFGGITVIVLLAVTLLLGWWGLGWRWLILCAIFYVPYFLLYTTFFTNERGWASGIWGSLSYWLDQQPVRRGDQQVYYFAMTLPAYEYLTIALATLGLIVHAIRRGAESIVLLLFGVALIPVIALVYQNWGRLAALPIALAVIALATAAMSGDRLRRLLVFFFASLVLGLSVSGEKMPWLTVHPALPLTILAGLAVNDIFGVMPAALRRLRTATWSVAAASLVLGAALAAVLGSRSSSPAERLGAAALFVAAMAGALVLLYAVARRRALPDERLPRALPAAMIATAAIAGFLGLITLRVDYHMNFVHGDTPDELLIYTQTSPDIPKVKRQIDQLAMESGEGANLPIVVDGYDSFTWPWAWYLRNYHNVSYPDLSAYLAPDSEATLKTLIQPGSVLLLNAQDQRAVDSLPGYFGAGELYHHRWWFPEEGYRTTNAHSFFRRLLDGSELRRWWTFVTNEDGITIPPSAVSPQPSAPVSAQFPGPTAKSSSQSIGTVDAVAFFPVNWVPGKGLVAGQAASTSAAAAHTTGATLTIGGGLGAGALDAPSDAVTDSAGNIYVVETGANRVRKFDASGKQLAATDPASPSLQFRQPWGIAVDSTGNVYVADTFNHRIVKLDTNLSFITAWGSAGQGQASPLALYGPRSIAIDAAGNLWVTDTGNARVVEFDQNGHPLGTFGDRGSGPGEFMEPVGIAVGPDGDFYVADTWNDRIEIFDSRFSYVSEFGGATWVDAAGGGQDASNKPYLAVLPDNTIVASFPDGARVVRFDRQGNVLSSTSQVTDADMPFKHPVGVSAGADGQLLVVDPMTNEIVRAPVSAFH